MAQKINPTNFRLGLIQVWKSYLQMYGKSFKQYFKILHKYLQIQNVIIRLFNINNFSLNHQEWKINRKKTFLNIYYSKLPKIQLKATSNNKFFTKVHKIIKQWFLMNVFIRFYLSSDLKPTTNLVVMYVQNLIDQNISSKKILWNLCKLLEKLLNKKKVFLFKKGIFAVTLKGFKVRLTGRIEGSKSQMAKSIEQIVGSLSLTNIKSYVEYKNKTIYTKSGTCGVQVWLFYKIN